LAAALLRCALVAIALAVVAWLVLSLRAVELQSDAAATLERARSGAVSQDDVLRARSSLRSARRLSVDRGSMILESILLAATSQREEAIAMAERVVAEEPASMEGWRLLYQLTEATDEQRAAEALERVAALNPHAAAGLR
jgi:hypothetical protein